MGEIDKLARIYNRIFSALLVLTTVMLPFNDLPYFRSAFGELAVEGAFYPVMAGMIIWGATLQRHRQFSVPTPSRWLLGSFLGWMLLSAAVNMNSILAAFTKGRAGSEKLLFQAVLVTFCILASIYLFNSLRMTGDKRKLFMSAMAISLIVPAAYSVFEILAFSHISWASNIELQINSLIHPNLNCQLNRIRTVSGEPSWFASYCAFVLPWLTGYCLSKGKNYWFYCYILVLVILTKSRLAYGIMAIQFIFLAGLIGWRWQSLSLDMKRGVKRLAVFTAIGIMLGIFASTTPAFTAGYSSVHDASITQNEVLKVVSSYSVSDRNNTYIDSNIARMGAQQAALGMFKDHPFFGIGIGQYGFYVSQYWPDWAQVRKSQEIKQWLSSEKGTAWPPVHNLYARIAAELGPIGLFLWLALWLNVALKCFKRFRENTQTAFDIFGLAILLSIVGVLLVGLSFDSFRYFGYWITIGVAWYYCDEVRITK